MHPRTSLTIVVLTATLVGISATTSSTQAPTSSIVGVWTLVRDLSDKPQGPPEGAERGGRSGRSGGGRGGGGVQIGGSMGRGGGGGRGGGRGNPGEIQAMRDAMRDIFEAPERMTIVQTESMVIITTGDGRTTRLSTDGTKIKDESSGIERKTHWEAGKLVTEISGAGSGKTIQTYALSADAPRLTVTYEMESGDNKRPPIHHVYDRES